MVAATVQLARWLDASSRRPPGLCALDPQKPQSPSLRSRLNDDRTFRSGNSAYLGRVRRVESGGKEEMKILLECQNKKY